MTFWEALVAIPVGLFTFLSTPMMVVLYSVILLVIGVCCFPFSFSREARDFSRWQRAWVRVFGVLAVWVGIALMIFAVSNPNSFSWVS